MSAGIGISYNDISPPKEREQEQEEEEKEFKQRDDQSTKTTQQRPKNSSFFSFRQLNALALIVILSASGMVCPQDIAFVVFTIFYMFFLSRFAFPKLTPSEEPPVFDPKNKLLLIYVSVGAIIGLFVPIAYIFEGIFEGDKEGIKAASPHVFLLASQVFLEGVAFSGRFSTPIRVFVPVCFNAIRVSTIMEWLANEFSKVNEEYGGNPRRLYIGRALAIANMAFWSFNLLGFLLPVYLPKAFKRYYLNYKAKD